MEHTFVKQLLERYSIDTKEIIKLLNADGTGIEEIQEELCNAMEWDRNKNGWVEPYTLALIIYTYYINSFDDGGVQGLMDWDRETYIQDINEIVLPLIEFSKTLY